MLDCWHPPVGSWPEISSLEETHKTLEMALCCLSGKLSSWDHGGDKMHWPTWRECILQVPGHLSCLGLERAQRAGPTESAFVKYPRTYLNMSGLDLGSAHNAGPVLDSSRARQRLSSTERERTHTPWAGANSVWPRHYKHSPHTPVIFVCSAPPSPQHGWANEPK